MRKYEIMDEGRLLGIGAYSKVYKVKHKKTGKIFAMKSIDMKKLNQEEKEKIL